MLHTDTRNNISILRKTNGRLPRLPFARIKNKILGKDYALSLVFPTLAESIALHKKWKHEKTPVNILSFPFSDDEGEVFITLTACRSEAKNFDRSYHEHLVCLFIHGLAHLSGFTHGSKMDAFEKKIQEEFLPL